MFVNLVETDMLWGHRNDPINFHRCLQDFDRRLPDLLDALRPGDLLIVTSDHGCDPTTPSTDHSREHALLLAYVHGKNANGAAPRGRVRRRRRDRERLARRQGARTPLARTADRRAVIVARLRLARTGETAGSPREPPSLTGLAPQRPHGAAPAMSVAAAEHARPATGWRMSALNDPALVRARVRGRVEARAPDRAPASFDRAGRAPGRVRGRRRGASRSRSSRSGPAGRARRADAAASSMPEVDRRRPVRADGRLTQARGVEAIVGDVQDLPFRDGIFDCAVAAWMLYHVPDLDRALRELRRVLRPDGRLVAATNSERTPARALGPRSATRPSTASAPRTPSGSAAPPLHHRRAARRARHDHVPRPRGGAPTTSASTHRSAATAPTTLPYFDGPLVASRHVARLRLRAVIRPAELIERKRDGGELAAEELRELVLGYTRGTRFPTTRWPPS